jgi:hypothetical protein
MMIRLGFAAQLATPPPGMTALLNDYLIDAQTQLYERHIPLRMLRWWPIDLVIGQRHYGIPTIHTGPVDCDFLDNDPAVDTIIRNDGGDFQKDGFTPGAVISILGGSNNLRTFSVALVTPSILTLATANDVVAATNEIVEINTPEYKALDEGRVEEVWLQDNTQWLPMTDGISAWRYNETGTGIPQNYEWTDQLEIWPPPDDNYIIWIRGNFGLLPFAADADTTTLDSDLVFLMALANAKNHYGQQDAGSIFRQLEVRLRKLNKRTFGQARYIPRTSQSGRVMTKPVATWRP